MSLIFITGGARSGKSRYAVKLAQADPTGKIAFIATAQAGDEEMAARIRHHQMERPAEWTTIEVPIDVASAIQGAVEQRHTFIIVDCLTLLVSNLTFRHDEGGEGTITQAQENDILSTVRQLADTANAVDATVIVISNELGMGIVPDNRLARRFRDIAGRANQVVAQAAAEVYLCVSGIPVQIKKGADAA